MEYDPRGGRAAPRVDARYMPDCAFFLAGKCLRGHACPFKHDPSRLAAQNVVPGVIKQQEICKYYNSPIGCARGTSCLFQHVKVADAPVEARINAALGTVIPRMLPAPVGPDDFHIELDQQAAQDPPPRVAEAARQRALGRTDAMEGVETQFTNGFGAQRVLQRPGPRSVPAADVRSSTTPQQIAVSRQRPDETVERPEPRSRDSARPATQREHSIREPVTKRLSRKDDSDVVPKKGVFARLSGGLVKDAAEERGSAAASMERPWRPTVASTVRVARATAPASEMPTKRKVAVIDESPDEEGELVQSERTVRVASARNAIRKQPTDSDRQPASSRLGVSDNGTAGTLQPRPRIGSRLSRPAAGQAPLRAPLEVSVGIDASSGTRTATSTRLPARALGTTDTDAPAPSKIPRSLAPVATQLSAKLDTPLSDRPQRSTAGTAAKAPPLVKSLQELRMERERNKQHQQPEHKPQPEPKRRRSSSPPSAVDKQSNQSVAPAAKTAPILRQRSAGKPSGEQPRDRRHPVADPATRTPKAGTPKAAEHADDFDWEADIAEDEVGQDDFVGGQAMDEAVDEEIVAVDEQAEDPGDDAAGADAQQDDFAKRMAAFADAFD